MKVLTSRVVLYAIVSIFAGFVAQPVYAEDKITESGGATLVPKAETPVKSGGTETRKIVASQKYVDDQVDALAAHKVNGAPLSNTSSYFFGTSSAAATAEIRQVTIDGITELAAGLMIIIKPTVTAAYADNTAAAAGKIQLKSGSTTFDAKVMRYKGAALTTTTDGYAWAANTPALWVYDGTYWQYVGTYDTNTTYSGMTVAEGRADSPVTTNRLISPKKLKAIVHGLKLSSVATDETGQNALSLDTSLTGTISTSDTILSALGKLQGQITSLSSTVSNIPDYGHNLVNGAPIKNESSTFFGRDESAPDQDKQVWIESIASLEDGIIIVVQPKYTSVKEGSTLKLNSFDAVPMYYNGHPVTEDEAHDVWNEKYPSTWVYNKIIGAWIFAGNGYDVHRDIDGIAGSVSDLASHKVNGAPISNPNSYFFDSAAGGAANSVAKTASISSIPTTNGQNPPTGLIITLVPATTTEADGEHTLKLGNFNAKPMFYRDEAVKGVLAKQIWTAGIPSTWVYNGTNWVLVSKGDDNDTTYTVLNWGDTQNTATDNYSITFNGGTGNWPSTDSSKMVTGISLAKGLQRKQNRLPALATSGDTAPISGGGSAFVANTLGTPGTRYITAGYDESLTQKSGGSTVLAYMWGDHTNDEAIAASNGLTVAQFEQSLVSLKTLKDAYDDLDIPVFSWNSTADTASDKYSITFNGQTNNWPNGQGEYQITAISLAKGLARKQNKLPYKSTGNAAPKGGQTIELISSSDTTNVTPTVRYITAGKGLALTAKSGAQQVLNYINGTTASATYATNQGLTEAQVKGSLVSLELLKDVYGLLSSSLDTMDWGSNEIAATNAYSDTFGTGTNNWPAEDQDRYVTGESLAGGLKLKQNKITGADIAFQLYNDDPVVTLPALASYDSTNGLVANTYGILGWEDDLFGENGDYIDISDFSDDWLADNSTFLAKVDKLVPSVRAVANSLGYRQQRLRAAYSTTTSYTTMKAKGSEVVTYYSEGNPHYQYVTAGANQPLTEKSGADNVMLYLTGAKTLAQMQTSNFGAPSSMATSYQNKIKNAIVNLELMKDLYPNSWTTTQNTAVDGYSTTFDGTTGNWPAVDKEKLVNGNRLAQGLARKQNKIAATSSTYTNGSVVTTTSTAGTVGERGIANAPAYNSSNELTNGDYIATISAVNAAANDLSGHKVNGSPLSNTSTVFAGKSTTAANTSPKEVSISGINELVDGLMVIVTPSETSTAGASNLKINNLDAKPMRYQNSALTTTTDGNVWVANTPSTWVYDGTAQVWRFAGYGKYDTNTTYYSMHSLDISQIASPTTAQTAGDAITGTATNNDVISPRVLKNAIHNINLTANTANTGETLATFSPTNSAITASDKVITAFGKAQGQINNINTTLTNLSNEIGALAHNVQINSVADNFIAENAVPVPDAIKYTGDTKLGYTTQLFWLPYLARNEVREASTLLDRYAAQQLVPSMDTLSYALDGLFQTRENTSEWQNVAAYYRVGRAEVTTLYMLQDLIENNDGQALRMYNSGYLQTFAPTLEALMVESAALAKYAVSVASTKANARQNKIPNTGYIRTNNTVAVATAINNSGTNSWGSANVKGAGLVTKTTTDGVVGERSIIDVDTTTTSWTSDRKNLAIPSMATMTAYAQKKMVCYEYDPDDPTSCWLWQPDNN